MFTRSLQIDAVMARLGRRARELEIFWHGFDFMRNATTVYTMAQSTSRVNMDIGWMELDVSRSFVSLTFLAQGEKASP